MTRDPSSRGAPDEMGDGPSTPSSSSVTRRIVVGLLPGIFRAIIFTVAAPIGMLIARFAHPAIPLQIGSGLFAILSLVFVWFAGERLLRIFCVKLGLPPPDPGVRSQRYTRRLLLYLAFFVAVGAFALLGHR